MIHSNRPKDRLTDVPTGGVPGSGGRLVPSIARRERQGGSVESEQPLRGNVVLVVDDDVDTATALAQLITDGLGCRVLTALSGDEALRVIDSGLHVDLVFADVVMPEMDGVTLAHLIGRRLATLPVVLATGRPDVVDSVTERGGIALLKPYSLERLEAVFIEHMVDAPRPTSGVRPRAA